MKPIIQFLKSAGMIFLLVAPMQLLSQHKGFSYQAVARDQSNQPLVNTTMQVHFSLLDETSQLVWKEQHEVTTNAFGLFSVIILKDDAGKTGGSAASLEEIDWGSSDLSLKLEMDDGQNITDMGTNPLTAVPYAMFALNSNVPLDWEKAGNDVTYVDGKVGVGTISPEGTLTIQGIDDTGTEPLLMVTRKDGYPVFAVYEHGVYAYTDTAESDFKGIKGGFAVGGYKSQNKGIGEEYMRVTADSIRFYIDDRPAIKGLKGGFAVGGYNSSKAYKEYFNISGKQEAEVLRGSQSRILWYPRKEAFLAGRVRITSPDSVGTNSFSTGFESMAIGDWSQAFGFHSVATGLYSTAIGKTAFARGDNSFAFGSNALSNGAGSFALGADARATRAESFALGQDARAFGLRSFAMGYGAEAEGEASYAIGQGTRSRGLGSFAMGFVGRDSSDVATGNTVASADFSVAFGMGAEASKKGAFSLGTMTSADGPFAFAIGYRTRSKGWYSLSTGYSTEASGNFSTAMGYGSIASGNHAFASGQKAVASNWYSVAIGPSASAEGQQSMAIGPETQASADFSMAMGRMSRTTGLGGIAIGFNAEAAQYGMALGYETLSSGDYSISMGFRSEASGEYAFAAGNLADASGGSATAFGSNTSASGNASIAAGLNNAAEGPGSVAMGSQNRASGSYAAAFGYNTLASGDWSFSAGQYTKATAWNTFAMGGGSEAKGHVSSAFGLGTIAKPFASFAVGRYNDTTCSATGATSWQDVDPLFMVGNGTMVNRHNAMTILKNGEVLFPDAYGHLVGGVNRDLYIDNTGKIGYVPSSARYKNDIRNMEQIGWLYDLRPVDFVYEADPSGSRQYGLIAEEVLEIQPALVSFNKEGMAETVSYHMLVTPMLKALQEQQEVILEQETRIQQQENDLRQKDLEMEQMKSRIKTIEEALQLAD